MPRYRKWIKSFAFEEQDRSSLTLQGVTIHPSRQCLEIAPVHGAYPTSALARTRVTKPGACRKWIGFFVSSKTAKAPNGLPITGVEFRLNDGVIDLFWNVALNGWLPAGPNDWNTEQEIADHISEWPSQSIGVAIRLTTTSPAATPYVHEVRLLFETDLIELEDYVVRSFVEELREGIRPISILAVNTTAGQTAIDLRVLQTPYDVLTVDALYDNTLDPDHMRPLSGWTYDADQKLISMPAQPAGHRLEVRFVWRPDIALMTSQDYTEIGKIPAIVVDRVELRNRRAVRERPYVLNKGSNEGFAFEEGYQADIDIPLRLLTAQKRDLHALQEEVARFFANRPVLRARGQDEFYPISADTNGRDDSTPSQKELHSAGVQAKIANAVFYPEDARPIAGVMRVTVDCGPNIAVR